MFELSVPDLYIVCNGVYLRAINLFRSNDYVGGFVKYRCRMHRDSEGYNQTLSDESLARPLCYTSKDMYMENFFSLTKVFFENKNSD